MKVIFLDIDGVLNSHKFFKERNEEAEGVRPFNGDRIEYKLADIDLKAVALLNDLFEKTGAKVVISSVWRLSLSVDQLKTIFKRVGFKGEIIDKTVQLRSIRGLEIAQWMETNPGVESFVILDDDSDMGDLMNRLVKTTFDDGLTENEVVKAVALLNLSE